MAAVHPASRAIPRDSRLDSTAALLREGYAFIPNRCRRLHSDIFETRLMLSRAVCISGEEAARVFYEPGRFTRRGATSPTALRLLQDKGSTLVLDGEAHRRRKAMLLSILQPADGERLASQMVDAWHAQLPQWREQGAVTLVPALREVLCHAVCAWTGVPVRERDLRRLARELGAMIDGAAAFGPLALRGLRLRRSTERWAREVINRVRGGEVQAPVGRALHAIAFYPGMDTPSAAVELLNVLRPVVAVERYITFAALALHQYPQCREPIAAGDDAYLERFVQEVRRFYPFFAAVGGRVLEPFEWRGHAFEKGDWVLLDLYGTLHDPRSWRDPFAFRPERFEGRSPGAFDLIPQGGGDLRSGHRCAGEPVTIALMKRAVLFLVAEMRYRVPPQDLRIDLARMPAAPESGFVVELGSVPESLTSGASARSAFPPDIRRST